jgi:putative endonuclease
MAVALTVGMSETDDRQALGKTGEDLACRELQRRGYAVLARRYRTRFGEIDIVCQDQRTVVFVEVRARRTKRYGEAIESITLRKRRRIGAMALDYLAWTNRLDDPCRFDVVAIDGLGTSAEKIRIVTDAFMADGS